MFDGQSKETIVYATNEGTEPFTEWLRALRDGEGRKRIQVHLARLTTQGNPGDYKTVGQGVYDLRVDAGPGYRLY